MMFSENDIAAQLDVLAAMEEDVSDSEKLKVERLFLVRMLAERPLYTPLVEDKLVLITNDEMAGYAVCTTEKSGQAYLLVDDDLLHQWILEGVYILVDFPSSEVALPPSFYCNLASRRKMDWDELDTDLNYVVELVYPEQRMTDHGDDLSLTEKMFEIEGVPDILRGAIFDLSMNLFIHYGFAAIDLDPEDTLDALREMGLDRLTDDFFSRAVRDCALCYLEALIKCFGITRPVEAHF